MKSVKIRDSSDNDILVSFVSQDLIVDDEPSEIDVLIKIKTRKIRDVERSWTSLCLVLDISGSMSGEPLENAKSAIFYVFDQLSEKDLVSLVCYSTEAYIAFENFTVKDRPKMKEIVKNLQSLDSTNMMAGVELGRQIFTRTDKKIKDRHLMVFTDGMVNTGITEPEKIYSIVKNLKEKNSITTNTFGFGVNYDDLLLRNMARLGNGIYYYIPSAFDLIGVFSNAFSLLTSIIARNVILNLVGFSKTQILAVYGLEEEPLAKKGMIKIGNLFSDDERIFLVKLLVYPEDTKTVPFFGYRLRGETYSGKPYILKKNFKIDLCVHPCQIDYVKEIEDRKTIFWALKEQKRLSDEIDVIVQKGQMDEKKRKIYTEKFDGIKKKLKPLKGTYEEADLSFKEIELSSQDFGNMQYEEMAKRSNYAAEMVRQTKKTYVKK